MSLTVYAGTSVQATGTFTDASGTATDPTTITMKFAGLGGTTTIWTYANSQITKVSTGVYQGTIDTTPGTYGPPGQWTVQFTGTGTCAAVQAMTFTVLEPVL